MAESRRPAELPPLPQGARFLYTAYLVLTLAAFAASLALYYGELGFAPAEAGRILATRSHRELLQTSHAHMFVVPLVMLALGHIFLSVRGGVWKRWIVMASVVFTVLHLSGPWLIRAGGAGRGWMMVATGVPFIACYLFMALWPLPELWPRRIHR